MQRGGVGSWERRSAQPPVVVLGSVAVVVGDEHRPLVGRPGRLLVELVVAEGRSVGRDRLRHALWGDAPPPTADSALRTHLTRVRRALVGTGVEVRRSGDRVSLVAASAQAVDVDLFDAEVAAAASSLADGLLGAADRHLQEAARLWRGAPFGEHGQEPELAPVVARLERRRALLDELRAEWLVSTGSFTEAVEALTALVAEDPLDEGRRVQLMRALYLDGRQAEALGVFDDLRVRLRDELGVSPGADARTTYQLILEQDPSLTASRIGRGERGPAGRHGRGLVGRGDLVAAVRRGLSSVSLVTLTGPPGIGKSAVLRAATAEIADRRVVLVEGDRIDRPEHLVAHVADSLGVVAHDTAAPLERIVAHAAAARPTVIALDGGDGLGRAVGDLVAALLEASRDGSVQLLAARRRPLGLDGEHEVEVPPLALADTAALLAAELADRGIEVGGDDVGTLERLAAQVDGHPLAAQLAVGWVALLGLSETERRLRAGALPLVAGSAFLRDVDATLDLLDPAAAAALLAAAAFHGPFDLAALSGVSGLDERSAARAMRALHRASLLHSGPTRGWMVLLAPIRDAARELGDEQGLSEQRRRAWVDTMRARLAAWPVERSGFDPAGVRAALGPWHADLRALIDDLARREEIDALVDVVLDMSWYWHATGDRRWAIDALGRTLSLVDRRGGHPGGVRIRTLWAQAAQTFAWHAAHVDDSRLAAEGARDAGDRAAEVLALCGLASGLGWQGDLVGAQHAIDAARRVVADSRPGELAPVQPVQVDELAALGLALGGDVAGALDGLEQVRVRFAAIGSRFFEVHALSLAGMVAALGGRPDVAERCMRAVIAGSEGLGDQHGVLHARLTLADLAVASDPPRAAREYDALIDLFVERGDLACAALAQVGRGELLLGAGDDEALGVLAAGAQLAARAQDGGVWLRAGVDLVDALRARGRDGEAAELALALQSPSVRGGRPVAPDVAARLEAACRDLAPAALAGAAGANDAVVLIARLVDEEVAPFDAGPRATLL